MGCFTTRCLISASAAVLVSIALGQAPGRSQPVRDGGQSLPPANGPRRSDPAWHALRNATVHVKPGQSLEHATVVFRDGVITAILPGEPGPDGTLGTTDDVAARVPVGPRVWECDGLHIYAGFIDPYVEVETPAPDPTSPGLHWNTRVTPQRRATDGKGITAEAAQSLRAQGFTAAAISPQGGLFKGQSAVVSLAAPSSDPSKPKPAVYRDGVYQSVALNARSGFGFGGGGGGNRDETEQGLWTGYPGSQMGAIALIRQTLIDADWQAQVRSSGGHLDLNAVDALGSGPAKSDQLPLLVDSTDELEALRSAKIAAEFKRDLILLGSGTEFRRLPAIVNAFAATERTAPEQSFGRAVPDTPIILPLNFPRPPDVTSIAAAESVELREMMTWEQAPSNPRRLDDAGLTVALTTAKLRNASDFRNNLRRAMRFGLAPDRALAMVTTTPARLLGVDAIMGSIESGKLANLIVADGDLFTPEKAPKKKPDDADKKDGEKKDKPVEAGGASPGSSGDDDTDTFDDENRAGQPQPGGRPRGAGARGGRGGPGGRGGRGGGGGEAEEKVVVIRDVWIEGQRHEVNAAPEPDITGTYDVTSDPPASKPGQIIIEKGDSVTIKAGDATSKARSVSRIKSKLSFVFDNDPFGEPKGVNTVSAVVEGDTIHGTGIDPAGQKVTFKAVKQPPSAAIGSWRVFEQDGKPEDANAEKNLVITITGGATPKLSLDFTRPGGKHVVIESSDFQLTQKGATFTHSLKDLGVDATSKDSVTIEGDTLTGESTLSDGAKHAYKARREPAQPGGAPALAGAPQTPAIHGTYLITRIDDKPNAAPGARPSAYIYVKSDNTIALKQGGQTYTADEPSVRGKTIKYSIDFAKVGGKGVVTSEATLSDDGKTLNGSMVVPDGTTHSWTAERRPGDPDTLAELPESTAMPFGPYAKDTLPAMPETIVVRNATIWTSSEKGIIKNGTLIIEHGKIKEVLASGDDRAYAAELKADAAVLSGALEKKSIVDIDASGKHITAGLIDCHSHTGISRGVNEGGQAVTSEVRIEDVTNPDAIGWYRELAGGLTTVNSLHGSANPIGGQNCVNKIRWGVPHPDDMHFEGAKPGIKFALGENVKQSNGDRASTRYPVTRMGVESLMRDRFVAAREYVATWKIWTDKAHAFGMDTPQDLAESVKSARAILDDVEHDRVMVYRLRPSVKQVSNSAPAPHPEERMRIAKESFAAADALLAQQPRRDLELEAIAEILAGDRLVHCHSYRQDEILMLARLSREFGFKLGTYQHNLEGYKVADAVKDSAIGASLFSDWWAYKVEVQDAIPYAGPIMHDVGVVVSYNSDSDELARRMNTEAAKAVTYGGLSPEEAIKFVTINPAKQLAIDSRVGSLEPGKDADFVIWSDNPLSQFAVCESTWIDGREYFSREQDKKDREHIAKDRVRLIQKILASGETAEEGGGGGSDFRPGDEVITQSGDCGCGSLHE